MVETMLSEDGQQGVIAMGGVSPYGENLRTQVLNEALKGERMVREVAEHFELTQHIVRSWLKKHYEDNPDDPRRHFVERESENYKRSPDSRVKKSAETEGETGSDDEMAKRDRSSRVEPKIREKILEEIAARIASGEGRTNQAIADEHGIHASTLTYWLRNPLEGDPGVTVGKPKSEARQRFIAALEAGKTISEARREAPTNGARAKKWHTAWKRAQHLVKARAAYADKMKNDPVFNEQVRESMRAGKRRARELAGTEQQLSLPDESPASTRTLISGSPPSEHRPSVPSVASQSIPPSALARVVQVQQEVAMGEIFEEAVNERNALRGMVAILEREAKAKDQKLAAYRRRFGDIES